MWHLSTEFPTESESGKRLLHMGGGIYTNMREITEEVIFGLPIISWWNKIGTLQKYHQLLLDWPAIKGQSSISTNHCCRWVTRLTAKELPMGQTMYRIVNWPTADCPRGYVDQQEDVINILQCIKGRSFWKRLNRNIKQWGQRNRAAPHLI